MAAFKNNATLTFNGHSVLSNTVTGEITDVLTGSKTAPVDVYRQGDRITYVISLVNSGSTALTDLTVTDDLGSYTFNTCTLTPLTYETGSATLFVNGTPQAAPTVTAQDGSLVFSGITVPADGNATVVYIVTVNEYAPLGEGACIENAATVTGDGIVTPLELSETVTADGTADLSIVKSLSPETVVAGEPITYTFEIANSGLSPVEATDDVTLTDDFDLIVSSFKKEYGVSLYSAEFRKMTWDEFCALLSGLGEDTPLARTVQIRLEDDPKVLEGFTSAQQRIRSQWRAKHTSVNRTTEERDAFLRELEAAFASSLSKSK